MNVYNNVSMCENVFSAKLYPQLPVHGQINDKALIIIREYLMYFGLMSRKATHPIGKLIGRQIPKLVFMLSMGEKSTHMRQLMFSSALLNRCVSFIKVCQNTP